MQRWRTCRFVFIAAATGTAARWAMNQGQGMGPIHRKEKGPPNEWLVFFTEAAEIPTIDPSERVIKVVATMGPAWDSGDKIINMVKAGVGIVRLNCSHRTINGKTGEFERLVPLIRAAGLATGKKVEILGDLQVSSPYPMPSPSSCSAVSTGTEDQASRLHKRRYSE
jgi:hypothetical protein